MTTFPDRRSFLGAGMAALALALRPSRLFARLTRRGHPDPRPGIDASHVLSDEVLASTPEAIPAYRAARAIPSVIDGIRCTCGCADLEGYYSLLTCYEEGGMARHCAICQGQARLAARLHRDGRSLDEIRAALDVRYG